MQDGVTFEAVARVVCSRLGWPWAQLTAVQWEQLRTEVDDALRRAWEAYWWEGLMVEAQVALRATWSPALKLEAGEWCFHEESEDYYCSLRGGLSLTAPSSLVDGVWVTDVVNWARLHEVDLAASGAWGGGSEYAVGVRCVWGGRVYACVEAHTAGTSLTADAAYWLPVPEFDYVLPYVMPGRPVIGRVRGVAAERGVNAPDGKQFEFKPVAEGIRIYGLDRTVPRPWVTYRVRCPQLDGREYDEGAYPVEEPGRAVWGL